MRPRGVLTVLVTQPDTLDFNGYQHKCAHPSSTCIITHVAACLAAYSKHAGHVNDKTPCRFKMLMVVAGAGCGCDGQGWQRRGDSHNPAVEAKPLLCRVDWHLSSTKRPSAECEVNAGVLTSDNGTQE